MYKYKYMFAALTCIALVACSSDGSTGSDANNTAANESTTNGSNSAEAQAEAEAEAANESTSNGADSAEAEAEAEAEAANESTTTELQTIANDGQTLTINSNTKTSWVIAGANNTVNVESNLARLVVSGENNLIIFSENISVDDCTVTGSDNTAQVPDSVSIDCNVLGSGNMGF